MFDGGDEAFEESTGNKDSFFGDWFDDDDEGGDDDDEGGDDDDEAGDDDDEAGDDDDGEDDGRDDCGGGEEREEGEPFSSLSYFGASFFVLANFATSFPNIDGRDAVGSFSPLFFSCGEDGDNCLGGFGDAPSL